MYDITKLRLSQGCVDYTVKNDLDSSSRHHFWPIFTFRSSNLFIDHFIASKNWLVSVYGPSVYGITKLRLLKGCFDYTVKNDLDSLSRHHFWPIYTFRSSNLFFDHLLHLKINCVVVYGHFVYDITKLWLSQGCVDYTVKNDLDSSSRHHFWPIYTFRSSNLFIDHFIASKNRLVSVYGLLVYGITKLRLLKGCVDYTVKNNLDSSSRHHFWPIYTFRSSNIFIDHFIASKNRLR